MTHTIEELRERAKIFKAFDHEMRLLILELLIERPRSVEDLCAAVKEYLGHGIEQPTVSSHLRRLRRASLVSYHQAGNYHEYFCREVQMVQDMMGLCATNTPHRLAALRRRRQA